MRWPNPLICQQPGELANQHLLPNRSASLRRLERGLRSRYAIVRIIQRLGWSTPWPGLLRPLRALASLAPRDPETQAAARELLRKLNGAHLAALNDAVLTERPSSHLLVPMIVGCRSRLKKAQRAQKAFDDCSRSQVQRALIVVGNPQLPDWAIRFCPERRLLELSADDHYEGLPQKVTHAFATLSLLETPLFVLKLDDDARPGKVQRLSEMARQMASTKSQAAGFPIVTPTPLHLDRGWHIGKSHRTNLKPFSSLGARTWLSGGAGYLLNQNAVDLIGGFWMHTSGFIDSMLYEDVCISMLLQAADTEFYWLQDPADLGLLSERQQEFDNGLWHIPNEFFHTES